MKLVSIYNQVNPIDILIELIKSDPESMGLDSCVNNQYISNAQGCPFAIARIVLHESIQSIYMPLQLAVTFDHNSVNIEAWCYKNNCVDKDTHYQAVYDIDTPKNLLSICNIVNKEYVKLCSVLDNFKTMKTYIDAEEYAAYVISNTINSFKKYFSSTEVVK